MDITKGDKVAPGVTRRRLALRDVVNRRDLDTRNIRPKKENISSSLNEETSQLATAVVAAQPPERKLKELHPTYSRTQRIFDPDEDSVEYAVDIFNYLKERERNFKLGVDFLEGHGVTPIMRQTLLDWLVDVNCHFRFALETLHLTVLFIDRFLEKRRDVTKANFQLVGVTAILIAAKYEEVVVPPVNDFVQTTDNSCSKKEILEMERTILVTLNFEVSQPTSIQFLRRYSQIANADREQYNFSKYLIELAIMDYKLAWVLPSAIAAAACCLAIAVQNNAMDISKGWSTALVLHSGYKTANIRPVMARLSCALINSHQCRSIRSKYATSTHSKVSTLEKSKTLIVRKLAGELKE